jgi:hypothetical protein
LICWSHGQLEEDAEFQRDYLEHEDLDGIIMWHVGPLLGNDREISKYSTVVAK